MRRFYHFVITALIVLAVAAPVLASEADDLQKKAIIESGGASAVGSLLDCSNVTPINCGEVLSGDNSASASNVDVYGCNSLSYPSGEDVYSFTLGAETEVTITMTPATADLDAMLLGSCDEADCIDTDTPGGTTPSVITTCLPAGTYYIAVDGWNGAVSAYSLELSCVDASCPTAPANDDCASAADLCALTDANGNFNVAYNTQLASNSVNLGAGNSCTGFSTNGGDVFYSICLQDGGSILANQDAAYDMALYLFTDCADPLGSCVAGSDNCCSGATETVAYTNTTGGDQTLYLGVDAFSSTGIGPGVISGEIIGCCSGPTATENTTWGSVKGLYQ